MLDYTCIGKFKEEIHLTTEQMVKLCNDLKILADRYNMSFMTLSSVDENDNSRMTLKIK